MRFWRIVSIISALIIMLAGTARADTVTLQNGDRISGQVVSMKGGKLQLKTSYAGVITIDFRKVTGLVTEKPVDVVTDGGDKLKGVAAPAEKGKMAVDGRKLELTRVAAINAPDPKAFKMEGEINAGGDLRSGNTNKERYDLDGRVVMSWEIHRLIFGAESHREQNKGDDTVDNDLGYAEYNRFISEQWYGLGNARVFRDPFQDINLRTSGGVGLGYQAWDTPITALNLELGPNYVYDDSEILGRREWVAARWALDFHYWFFDKFMKFFHRDEIFQRVDILDQYFYNTRTGVSVPIRGGLVATLQFDYDWNNDPAPGKDKEDSRLLLKLGYHW